MYGTVMRDSNIPAALCTDKDAMENMNKCYFNNNSTLGHDKAGKAIFRTTPAVPKNTCTKYTLLGLFRLEPQSEPGVPSGTLVIFFPEAAAHLLILNSPLAFF